MKESTGYIENTGLILAQLNKEKEKNPRQSGDPRYAYQI